MGQPRISAPRIFALGGSGLVGRYALRTLRRLMPEVAVTLADRDMASARSFADELGGDVRCLPLDVTDEDSLRAALADAPLVMNTVGPYFRFGLPILRAALEAGCDYVDVCDDPEPTLAMLDLAGLAHERDATAVLGLGISPGVTNLLAVHAISLLDEARELITGWSLDSAKPEVVGPEPSAATLHGIEQLTGSIRVRRGGAFVHEAPGRPTRIDFPGAAECRCYTIGHPEPVTLPRTFPELKESVNVMSTDCLTAGAIRLLGKLIDRGLVTPRTAAAWAERLEGPSKGDIDHGGVDATLGAATAFGIGTVARPKVDVQLKATRRGDIVRDDEIAWPLKKQHYDSLRVKAQVPHLLVVLLMPDDEADDVEHTVDALLVRRCAYWVTMTGMPASDNAASCTVKIPKKNVFSPDALREILGKVSRAEQP